MLNIGRSGEMRKAFQAMEDHMVQQGSPAEHWSCRKEKTSYHECRKRWLQWTAIERSGTGPDADGLMQAPKEAFDRLIISKDKLARWLLYEPLKNLTAYIEVFAKESATGARVREAGETSRTPETHAETLEKLVTESPQTPPTEEPADDDPF